MKKNLIIITGPTAVGKTAFSLELAGRVNGEIINADMGQFYTPLSIGTAKPDLATVDLPHHLFNIVDEPRNFTVAEYNKLAHAAIESLWLQNKTPIIVGGSGFYIQSLLFPPQESPITSSVPTSLSLPNKEDLWQSLHAIDPERASHIHPNDTYRLIRALTLFHTTQQKPSAFEPATMDVFFDHLTMIVLDRDRDDLYDIINKRTTLMLNNGWIEEVENLNDQWKKFLVAKKIIGYDTIAHYLHDNAHDKDTLENVIAQKTRNYAKRQLTFFRRLVKKLEEEQHKGVPCSIYWITIDKDNPMNIIADALK